MIPTETDLVKIPAKVLRTQIMKYALLSSFENRAKGLRRIIMDIATGIFFLTVVDPIMGCVLSANGLIRMIFIGHQMRLFIDKAIKLWGKLCNLITGHRCGPNRAVALHGNQHSLLGSSFTALMFNPFFVTGFVTEVRLFNPTGVPVPLFGVDVVKTVLLAGIIANVVKDEELRFRADKDCVADTC